MKRFFSKRKLQKNDISKGLLDAEYAVRGFIPMYAEKIK